MAFDNLNPPVSNFSEYWDLFTFHLASSFGFIDILGLFIWALFTWFIFIKRGIKNATVFGIISIPIIVNMNWLPTWANLISYILVVLFGVRLYVQATEGF